MSQSKILDTPYVYLELNSGIIRGYYKSKLKIDLQVAKQIVNERKAFLENKTYPAMIIDQGVRTMNKEARDYFSSKEGSSGITAAALVLNSSFSKMFGNFLLYINKPLIPVKIFNDEDSALAWLEDYKNKDQNG